MDLFLLFYSNHVSSLVIFKNFRNLLRASNPCLREHFLQSQQMYVVKYNLFLHGSLISLHPQSFLLLRFLLFQCFTPRFGLLFSEAFTAHAEMPTSFMIFLLLALASQVFFHLVVGRLYQFLSKLLILSVLQDILLRKHRLDTLFG